MENKTCANCGHDRAWHYNKECNIVERKQSPACNASWLKPCKCQAFVEPEMTVEEYRACSHGIIDQERHYRGLQLVEWHFCHICGKFLKEIVLEDISNEKPYNLDG
jgi:hypothetical protein